MSVGSLLKEIHRLRKNLKDLETRILQAPKQLKVHENLVVKRDDELKQAQDAIKKLKVGIHDKEVSIKSIAAVIKKHEKQHNEAANKKEYDALQLEIKNEKASISTLEDQILEAMGQVDDSTAKLPELEQAAKKAKAELEAYKKGQDERLALWKSERERVVKEIVEIEAGLPDDTQSTFHRAIKAMGEDALASVENRICSACYTEITAQMHNEMTRGQFMMCKNCGRMLYLP